MATQECPLLILVYPAHERHCSLCDMISLRLMHRFDLAASAGICVFCGRVPRHCHAGRCALCPARSSEPWSTHPQALGSLSGLPWWGTAVHVAAAARAAEPETAGSADFDSLSKYGGNPYGCQARCSPFCLVRDKHSIGAISPKSGVS